MPPPAPPLRPLRGRPPCGPAGLHPLGGYLATYRGVGPLAVAVALGEPHDRAPGLGPRRPAPERVHLVLERGEERLGDGVVAAAARTAHGGASVEARRSLRGRQTRVLRPAVGTEDCAAGHVAARMCNLQRRNGRPCGHPLGHGPAYNHAGSSGR